MYIPCELQFTAQIVRVSLGGLFLLVVDGKWRDGKCVFLSFGDPVPARGGWSFPCPLH